MEIRRINFYGGPGIGKSTIAPEVYVALKKSHRSVEQVGEYIKSWAYENRTLEVFDQNYIFAKQQRLENRVLKAGVGIVVTDSPLYLQAFFANKNKTLEKEEVLSLAHKFEVIYPGIHLLLKRDKTRPYQQQGRYETLEQACELDELIEAFLVKEKVPFIKCNSDIAEVLTIVHSFVEFFND